MYYHAGIYRGLDLSGLASSTRATHTASIEAAELPELSLTDLITAFVPAVDATAAFNDVVYCAELRLLSRLPRQGLPTERCLAMLAHLQTSPVPL